MHSPNTSETLDSLSAPGVGVILAGHGAPAAEGQKSTPVDRRRRPVVFFGRCLIEMTHNHFRAGLILAPDGGGKTVKKREVDSKKTSPVSCHTHLLVNLPYVCTSTPT